MRQNGAVSDFEGGVPLTSSNGQDQFEPFGSLFCPDWRESEAQLTEKQAVLLMHDIYRQREQCHCDLFSEIYEHILFTFHLNLVCLLPLSRVFFA